MKNIKEFLGSTALVFLFSVLLVLVSEYTHFCNFSDVLSLFLKKSGVILFCAAILFFMIMSIIWATSSMKIGPVVICVLVFTLAIVEFYKYDVSGSHFVIADMIFASDFQQISGFAVLTPKLHIFIAGAILALVIVGLCFAKPPKIKVKWRRFVAAFLSFAVAFGLFFFGKCYTLAGFDTEPALTLMRANERFENDGFFATFLQDAREYSFSDLKEPDGYSEEYMQKYQVSAEKGNSSKKPNVVIILSESYADLREVSDNDEAIEFAYAKYDDAKALSSSSLTSVPTFGGYTVRSEFEMVFGLPSISMSNVPAPHLKLCENQPQNTLVREYLNNGYSTTYIHPYIADFYDRDTIYPLYGFTNMYFDEDFDEETTELCRGFISDSAVYKKVAEQLQKDEEPSFVFAMTMQNHQPYVKNDGTFDNELGNYLEGAEASSEAVFEFFSWLETFPEETIVLFLGDHYPFFSPQGGVYAGLNAGAGLSEEMYTQSYLVYSNKEKIELPEEEVSLFYLPHYIYDKAGLPECGFVNTMLDHMAVEPIYSIAGYDGTRSGFLDTVTYDRVYGECYIK